MLVVNSQSRDRLGATKPARPVANCLSNQAGGPLEQNADDLKRRICSISLLPHLFCRKPVPTFRRDALVFGVTSYSRSRSVNIALTKCI